MQHHPRASSCQPIAQPPVRLTRSSLSEGDDCPQPCPANAVSSAVPAAASVNNTSRAASTAELNPSQARVRKPVPRAASVNSGARGRDASRVASRLLTAAALPDSILRGGFHRDLSSCSSLTQHDSKRAASTRRGARPHSRNSRQGSISKHQPSMQTPPALTNLVQPTTHLLRREGTLALRSATSSPRSLSRLAILRRGLLPMHVSYASHNICTCLHGKYGVCNKQHCLW